jgi:hypothetical protein
MKVLLEFGTESTEIRQMIKQVYVEEFMSRARILKLCKWFSEWSCEVEFDFQIERPRT